MEVPSGQPSSVMRGSDPPSIATDVPDISPGFLVRRVTRETAEMDARASPRKPIVVMRSRSSSVEIFEVAWRKKARGASSLDMPEPLSVTFMSLLPPSIMWTAIVVAPASSEFSRSSFKTDSGRSTTSPAAIFEASDLSRMRMQDMGTIKTQRPDFFQKSLGGERTEPPLPLWERAGERGVIVGRALPARKNCEQGRLIMKRWWAVPTLRD